MNDDKEIREWCPNCEHFFKDFGMNYCHLANWREHPINGGIPSVVWWLKNNSDDSTRIHDDADDCPGFVPYAELAQRLYRNRSAQ